MSKFFRAFASFNADFESRRAFIAAYYRLLSPVDGSPFAESFFSKHPTNIRDLHTVLRFTPVKPADINELSLSEEGPVDSHWIVIAEEQRYLPYLLECLAADFKWSPWHPLIHSILVLFDYHVCTPSFFLFRDAPTFGS